MRKIRIIIFVDGRLNMIGKKIKEKYDSGITLTNNEIRDIMKVIKPLENREVSLKRTTTKITSQKVAFSNFLKTLMTFQCY